MLPSDTLADIMRVITTISNGKLPTVACDEMGVSYSLYKTYCKKYPQIAALAEEAEDRLYDLMAEALPHIHEHHVYGSSDPKLANVISTNIKWLLARRRQKAYGDKVVMEHTITADREILDALQHAKARATGKAVEAISTTAVGELALDLVMGADGSYAPAQGEDDLSSLF